MMGFNNKIVKSQDECRPQFCAVLFTLPSETAFAGNHIQLCLGEGVGAAKNRAERKPARAAQC